MLTHSPDGTWLEVSRVEPKSLTLHLGPKYLGHLMLQTCALRAYHCYKPTLAPSVNSASTKIFGFLKSSIFI